MINIIPKEITADIYLDELILWGFRPTVFIFPISQKIRFDACKPDAFDYADLAKGDRELFKALEDWYLKPENWIVVHMKCIERHMFHLVQPHEDYHASGSEALAQYEEARKHG